MFSFFKKWFQPKPAQETSSEIDPVTAAIVLMMEVAWSDNTLDDAEEETILKALQQNFDLNPDKARNLFIEAKNTHEQSVGSYEYTRLVNNQFNYDDKKAIIQTLWQIAHSDQHIDMWEEHAIRKIADLLYIDHQDFIATKIKTKQSSEKS